jgi:hypothetical protein
MAEAKAYLAVAERALLASDGALANGVHEKATFLGYHAFESLGGAFCARKGAHYPLGHASKLKKFVSESKHKSYAVHVAQLAISFGSLRNAVLYPAVAPNGTVIEPKNVISESQARRLIGRTESLLKKVKPNV